MVSGATDPASLAATAGILRRAAADLETAVLALSGQPGDAGVRPSAALRRRLQELLAASSQLGVIAQDLAESLNRAAYRHAEAAHSRAALDEEAALAGLSAGVGGFRPAPSALTVADAQRETDRAGRRAELTARAEVLAQDLRAQRLSLAAHLDGLGAEATRIADCLR